MGCCKMKGYWQVLPIVLFYALLIKEGFLISRPFTQTAGTGGSSAPYAGGSPNRSASSTGMDAKKDKGPQMLNPRIL